jgi:hypothetical protein
MRKLLLAAVAVLGMVPALASAYSGGYHSYGGGYHSYAAPRVYMAPRPYYRPRIIIPIVPIVPIIPIMPIDPCPYDYHYSGFYDRCVPNF